MTSQPPGTRGMSDKMAVEAATNALRNLDPTAANAADLVSVQ